MARVVLHIDRLVLKGLQEADVPAISAELRQELQSRLVDNEHRAMLMAQQARGVLKIGKVHVASGEASFGIGTALAREITGGGRQ